MGKRMLHSWLEKPLIDIKKIHKRNSCIESFLNNYAIVDKVSDLLNEIGDIERILAKISYSKHSPKDLYSLKESIKDLSKIKTILSLSDENLKFFSNELDDLSDIYELISSSIVDDPPFNVKDGGVIKAGYSEELDKIKESSTIGKKELVEFEKNEKESTGIKNLKIVFNKKTGYFIDITKSYLDKVPSYYNRIQTLTNSERFFTNKLKEIENKIFSSEDEALEKENEIFNNISNIILNNINRIQSASNLISRLDSILSLTIVAKRENYFKPEFNNKGILIIKDGKHPIISYNDISNSFIANDTNIGDKDNRIQIITGPNMSGKSTYLRQVALISILAQMGSFVPCKEAFLPILDKIFTRIGSSDNIVEGDSTFMVEMKEMAYILENATINSLILLDEIGRGTSTFDGLSIAWAIVEYLSKNVNAKCLFATHYHEITDLENSLNNVKNYFVDVKENSFDITFLYKVKKGVAEKSFGIEVAKLAGIDNSILKRSRQILHTIEKKYKVDIKEINENEKQIDFQAIETKKLVTKLKNLDIDSLSPRESFNLLDKLIIEAKSIED